MKKLSPLIISALLMTACAGTPFKWSESRQIKQGMTTAEVIQLIGKPTRVTAAGDQLIYVWVSTNTFSGQMKTLRVDFKDGKAIDAPPIPAEFTD